MSNNNRQEEEGGISLGKDEVQGCFDGRSEETKEKTFSKVPVRRVGDIMFLKMLELASCLPSLLGNRRNVNFVLFLGAACENGTCYACLLYTSPSPRD